MSTALPSLSIGRVTDTSIEVRWQATSGTESRSFMLQLKKGAGGTWRRVYVGSEIDFNATELEPLTTYYLRIAFEGDGDSFSEATPVTTKAERILDAESLHKAVASNDEEGVAAALDAGVDVDVLDDMGNSPLMRAATLGHERIVALLLERNAGLDIHNLNQKNSLMCAASKGQVDVIGRLLDAGANIAAEDRGGLTALHYAVDGQHANAVHALIQRGADINHREHQHGRTPLMRAAASVSCPVDVVATLLTNGADPNLHDHEGLYPLRMAVVKGRSDVADVLLRNGADFALANEGKEPLMAIARSSNDMEALLAVLSKHQHEPT